MLEILNYTAASTYLAWRVTHVSHAWRGTIHENKIVQKSWKSLVEFKYLKKQKNQLYGTQYTAQAEH